MTPKLLLALIATILAVLSMVVAHPLLLSVAVTLIGIAFFV